MTTKHIDVEAIRQNPRVRFDFLTEFCLLKDEDWAALDESIPHLAPRLPGILDRLYGHLLEYDDTRRIFLGPDDTIDPAYIELRKEHMTEWIMRAMSPGDRDDFVKYVVRIGRRHTGVAGESERAVPPRYMVALTSFIQTVITEALFDALLDATVDDRTTLRRAVLAWNKILLIQLELFLHQIAPKWPGWDEA